VLGRFNHFVSVNGALEADLSGQPNAVSQGERPSLSAARATSCRRPVDRRPSIDDFELDALGLSPSSTKGP
jgi:hypothetical protein